MTDKVVKIGNLYDDFEVGQVFRHHWGRTITETDNTLYTTLTMHFNPLYFNREYAERFGHKNVVINPMLVFHTVLGISVEDLSEAGRGPFLGVDDVRFLRPVYPGDTLYAASKVIDKRESNSRPEFGIVTWDTVGLRSDGDEVIRLTRRNLISKTLREPTHLRKEK